MNIIRTVFLTVLCLGLSTKFYAQNIAEKDLEQIKIYEDSLSVYAHAILTDTSDVMRFFATQQFIPTLVKALKFENSFQYKFPMLESISIQYPQDSTFRIFTFQLFVNDDEYKYFGAIQMNSKELQLSPLIDRSEKMEDFEQSQNSNTEWYGSVYYNILDFPTPEGTKYLLFGYDAYRFFNKQKLVDVLSFSPEGKPIFGAPVFHKVNKENQKEIRNRILLRYYAEGSIRLNFDPNLDCLIFDHLIELGGSRAPKTEGPIFVSDGSYEAYRLNPDLGIWQHDPKVYSRVEETAPMPEPILQNRKSKDIFGREKQ